MAEARDTASIPIAYAELLLELGQQRGVDRARMLRGLGISESILSQPNSRLSGQQIAALLMRLLDCLKDPALGYEIGLRSSLASHGAVGYGLLSVPSLREGLDFGIRFVRLRTPFIRMHYFVEAEQAIIQIEEQWPLGKLRQLVFDLFLVGLWRMAPQLALTGAGKGRVELHFSCPQPDYFEVYQARLPGAKFDQAANQLRFPAALLDVPMASSDRTAARLMTAQGEQELTALGGEHQLLSAQVQARLKATGPPYLSLRQFAEQLGSSTRSIKRRLQLENTCYSALLEAERSEQARHLLSASKQTAAQIGERLGYADPANFSRAFKKWQGLSPGQYRASIKQPEI